MKLIAGFYLFGFGTSMLALPITEFCIFVNPVVGSIMLLIGSTILGNHFK